MNNHKGTTIVSVIVIILAILALGVTGYFFYNTLKNTNESAGANTVLVNVNTNSAAVANENTNAVVNANANTNANSNVNATTDATKDWKTYTSKQYGLTFKYPTTWTVEEGTLNGPYSIFAHPKTTPQTSSLRFWPDYAYDGMQTPSGAKTTKSDVTYAERSAVLSKVTTSSGELLIAHVQFDTTPVGWGSSSTISIFPDDNGSIDIPLQILGLLTITNPTAGWKTYTDTTYGYLIKYPSSYASTGSGSGHTFQKGQLAGDPTYRVDIVVYTSPIEDGQPGQDIYTWAKNGFPNDTNVKKFHANLRQVKLAGITYWTSDGDLASTPVPDYMVFRDNKLYVLTDFRAVDKSVNTNETIISTFIFTK